MIDVIYIENAVRNHPRTRQLLQRFKNVEVVYCERYGEVFNRRSQNFRLQKQHPALILAEKHDNFVLPAPEAYGIGEGKSYYFSHMMNCIYDCRYCFLQGMYQSAHYVLFVNYEDFFQSIEQTMRDNQQRAYFFSGYDCDSLALEPISGFIESTLPIFSKLPDAILELRTKSTQVRGLLDREPMGNVVVAFSLSPENIVEALEAKTPSLQKRLDAAKRLQERGWQVGLRFDPVIYYQDYEQHYTELFEQTFSQLDASTLHSVSLGAFRMPQGFFQKMQRLFPREVLFSSPFEECQGMLSYRQDIEKSMMDFCSRQLLTYIGKEQFFPCQ